MLRSASPWLRRGVWIPVGTEVWRHLGASVPDHLHSTRIRRGPRDPAPTGEAGASQGRDRHSLLRAAAKHALPPWMAVVLHSDARAPYGLVLPAAPAGSGNAVLIDCAGRQVMRRSSEPFGEQYFALRERLAESLPIVEVLGEVPGGFVERYADGRRFGSLTAEQRTAAAALLIDRYVTHIGRHGTTAPEAEVGPMCDALDDELRLSPSALALLGGVSIGPLLRTTKWAPIHGDVVGPNLAMTDEGILLFDLDPRCVRMDACWYDVVDWLHPRADPDQAMLWELPELDGPLVRLGRAAGWPPADATVTRTRLRAAFAALRGWRRMQRTPIGHPDRGATLEQAIRLAEAEQHLGTTVFGPSGG